MHYNICHIEVKEDILYTILEKIKIFIKCTIFREAIYKKNIKYLRYNYTKCINNINIKLIQKQNFKCNKLLVYSKY